MVAAASKANLPFNLSISSPGLPTKSYVIQGTAEFLKFNGPTFAYVNSPFTITVNSGSAILVELFPWILSSCNGPISGRGNYR